MTDLCSVTAGDLRETAQSYLKKLEDLMAYEDRCALPDLSSPHCGHPWVLITYDKMCWPQNTKEGKGCVQTLVPSPLHRPTSSVSRSPEGIRPRCTADVNPPSTTLATHTLVPPCSPSPFLPPPPGPRLNPFDEDHSHDDDDVDIPDPPLPGPLPGDVPSAGVV